MIDKKDATCCYTSGFLDGWHLLKHDVIHVCAYFKGRVASHLIWLIEKKKKKGKNPSEICLHKKTDLMGVDQNFALFWDLSEHLKWQWPVAKLAHNNIVSISISANTESQFNTLSIKKIKNPSKLSPKLFYWYEHLYTYSTYSTCTLDKKSNETFIVQDWCKI